MSAGKLFHNFDLELKMPCQSRLNVNWGMCSKLRAVDLVCLSWCSETYMSIDEIYSGAFSGNTFIYHDVVSVALSLSLCVCVCVCVCVC